MQSQKRTSLHRFTIPVALFFVVLAVSGAFAKGTGKLTRIEGTVKSIGKDSVTVETDAKQTVNVKITSATKFLKDKKASTFSTMKTGDHVVFMATPSSDTTTTTTTKNTPSTNTKKDTLSLGLGFTAVQASY